MGPTHTSQPIDGRARCENDPFISGYKSGAVALFVTVAALVLIGAWWFGRMFASRGRRIALRAGCILFLLVFGLSRYVSTKAETDPLMAACGAQVGCENTCRQSGANDDMCTKWCECLITQLGKGEAEPGESAMRAAGRFVMHKEPTLSSAEHAATIHGAQQACTKLKPSAE